MPDAMYPVHQVRRSRAEVAGFIAGLRRYESITRIQGPGFVVLALLSLAGLAPNVRSTVVHVTSAALAEEDTAEEAA